MLNMARTQQNRQKRSKYDFKKYDQKKRQKNMIKKPWPKSQKIISKNYFKKLKMPEMS